MEGGPPRFPQGFPCPAVLGCLSSECSSFAYRPVTVFGAPFQRLQLDQHQSLWQATTYPERSHDPLAATLVGLAQPGFRLIPVRSPLLGESLLLSFPSGTEMFQFPEFAAQSLCVQLRAPSSSTRGVFPFRDLRITACVTAPRSLSQLPASFIASKCQGIHRAPLVACSFNPKSANGCDQWINLSAWLNKYSPSVMQTPGSA